MWGIKYKKEKEKNEQYAFKANKERKMMTF